MLLTTVVFFAVQAIVHARLMATRKILWKPWRGCAARRACGSIPGYFTRLVPAYLAYFRPRFHPNDRDTRALVRAWRERLFGEHGQLRAA